MSTIKINGKTLPANSREIHLPGGVIVKPSDVKARPPADLVAPGIVSFTLVHGDTEYQAEAPQGVFGKIGSSPVRANVQFVGHEPPKSSCCG